MLRQAPFPAAGIRSFSETLVFRRAQRSYRGALSVLRLPQPWPEALLRSFLSRTEQEYCRGLGFEKRRQSFLAGRYAAKSAVAALTGQELREIELDYGVFHNPLLTGLSGGARLGVSITHACGFAAALAFPDAHPMGIDLERMEPGRAAVMERECTGKERQLLASHAGSVGYQELLTLAWTAKESLSKVLRTGLTTPLWVFEIEKVERQGPLYLSHYCHFSQYKAISLVLGDHLMSIACPKNSALDLDPERVARGLSG